MTRGYFLQLFVLAAWLWSGSLQAQVRFRFEPVAEDVIARAPSIRRVLALLPDGNPDPSVNGSVKLRAHSWPQVPLVITELAADGEAIEVTNPGTSPVETHHWELECLQGTFTSVRSVRHVFEGGLLPPGRTMVWTSRNPGEVNSQVIVAGSRFNAPESRVFAFQIRRPDGRVVDQVVLQHSPALEGGWYWNGDPLGVLEGTGQHWLRTGERNAFAPSDWIRGAASLGTVNAQLARGWRGIPIPVQVQPDRIEFVRGVWTGEVTLPEPASGVSLAVVDVEGVLTDSEPFPVWPIPRDPVSGALPRLVLSFPPDQPGGPFRESSPGHRDLLLTGFSPLSSNLVVRLSSDAPGEVSLPGEILLRPGGPGSVRLTVTNWDDPWVDGRARVTLTAAAPGFLTAEMVVWNDDDESGTLSLQVPRQLPEDGGIRLDVGRVFLESPARHAVEVTLAAEAPLIVPAGFVVIPQGQAEASFPLRVGGDDVLSRPGAQATVRASTAAWPVAVQTVEILEDEPDGLSVVWPPELVEGTPAAGTVFLKSPRKEDVSLRFETGVDRWPSPPAIRIPAGVTEIPFTLLVPNDSIVNAPVATQICVMLENRQVDCHPMVIEDDDVSPVMSLSGYIVDGLAPHAVFSGDPFLLEVRAPGSLGVLQRTNFVGTLRMRPHSGSVSLDPGSTLLGFTHSLATKEVVLHGTALNASFEVQAAGLQSDPLWLSVLQGFFLSGTFYDLAANPGRGTLLISAAGPEQGSGELWEVDPETGNILRVLRLPEAAARLAVSDGGAVAWLAGAHSLYRVDLQSWGSLQRFPVDPGNPQASVKALAVLPEGTDRVLALVNSEPVRGLEARVVAFVNGRALPESLTVPDDEFRKDIEPGRDSNEAFVGSGGALFRAGITASGVVLKHQGSLGFGHPIRPNFVVQGNRIFTGNGWLLSADTLSVEKDLGPSGGFGSDLLVEVVPFAEAGQAGWIGYNGQFEVFDLAPTAYRGSHPLPVRRDRQPGASGRLIRCGDRRMAQILEAGARVRVWESPLISAPAADVQIRVEAPSQVSLGQEGQWAEWKRTVTVFNAGPGPAYGVEIRRDPDEQTTLGTLAAGESSTVDFLGGDYLPGIRVAIYRVTSKSPDPIPSNNEVRTETHLLAATRDGARALALQIRDLIASPSGNRLFAALIRRPGADSPGIAVINPETASLEKVFEMDDVPVGLAVSADGRHLFARTAASRVARVNLESASVEAPLVFPGESILDIACLPAPDGRLVVATSKSLRVLEGAVVQASFPLPTTSEAYLGFGGGLLWMTRLGVVQGYRISDVAMLPEGAPIPFARGPGGPDSRFALDSRRLYFRNNHLDIASRMMLDGGPGYRVVPDPVFPTLYVPSGTSLRRLDPETLEVNGEESVPVAWAGDVRDAVRWGEMGMAIWTDEQMILYPSSLVGGDSTDLQAELVVLGKARPHEPVTTVLRVTNLGPMKASRVKLELSIPDTYVPPIVEPPSAIFQNRSALLSVPELPVGGAVELRLTGAFYGDEIRYRGQVISSALDLTPADNIVEKVVPNEYPVADVAIHSSSVTPQVRVGEVFPSELVLTNRGPEAVSGLEVSVTRAQELQLRTVEGGTVSQECCGAYFQILIPGPLAAGESRVLKFQWSISNAVPVALGTILYNASRDSDPLNNRDSRLVLASREDEQPPRLTVAHWMKWNHPRNEFLASVFGHPVTVRPDLSVAPALDAWVGWYGAAFSDDGRYSWSHADSGRLDRFDFELNRTDMELVAPEGLDLTRLRFAVAPGQPDVVILAAPNFTGGFEVIAYRRGRALPRKYDGMGAGADAFLAIAARGEFLVSNAYQLRQLRLQSDGLVESRNLDSVSQFPSGTFEVFEDRLYLGAQQSLDLVNLKPVAVGPDMIDPNLGLGYTARMSMSAGPPVLTVQSWDLVTDLPIWRREVGVSNAMSGLLIPMGTNGLMFSGETTIPIPPPAGPRQTDLQIGARLQTPVLGTNQYLWLDVSITNRSEWYASRPVLELRHSEGLVLHPPSPPERLELAPLMGETNVTFLLRTTAPGPQWIHVEVVDPLPDVSLSDTVAELRWETPPPPVLSVADQEVYEGGAVALVLSTPAPSDLEVSFEAVPISAQLDDVYSGTLGAQFRAGEVRGWLFAVRQDENSELNETFHLRFLGGAVRPSRTESVVTILDDDQPSVRPADLRIREGDTGTLEARWPIQLSRASLVPVEVRFRVGPGSASAGSDFAARTGRLRFEPGETVRYVTVPIVGDTLFEPDETVMVELVEGWGGPSPTRQGTLIVENDDPRPPPSLTLRPSSGQEWILGFSSSAGSNYRIQFRTDLDQGDWDEWRLVKAQ